jgi:hypothetical protein
VLDGARLFQPLALPALGSDAVANYENAAEKWHRVAIEQQNQLLARLVDGFAEERLGAGLQAATVAELGTRLRTLDVSREPGLAELRLVRREVRRRDSAARATLQSALDAAVQRVKLPDSHAHAAEVFDELDLLVPLLDVTESAIKTGNDQGAQNFEASRFLVLDKNGRPLSLADGGRLSDREKWETFRADEAAANAAAVQKLGTEITRVAATGDVADAAPTPTPAA